MRPNLAQIAAQDGERCRPSRRTTPRLIVETQAKRRSRWVTRFVDSGDPLVIGQQVYARDRARWFALRGAGAGNGQLLAPTIDGSRQNLGEARRV